MNTETKKIRKDSLVTVFGVKIYLDSEVDGNLRFTASQESITQILSIRDGENVLVSSMNLKIFCEGKTSNGWYTIQVTKLTETDNLHHVIERQIVQIHELQRSFDLQRWKRRRTLKVNMSLRSQLRATERNLEETKEALQDAVQRVSASNQQANAAESHAQEKSDGSKKKKKKKKKSCSTAMKVNPAVVEGVKRKARKKTKKERKKVKKT